MKLISNDFTDQSEIPAKFTCDSDDISPHLQWSDFPPATMGFALSCKDPDAPGGNWDHWLIINIPVTTTVIPQGMSSGEGVINDFGKPTYGGPCPPSGKHRYNFIVYALDIETLEDITKDNFVDKCKEHTLDSAQIVGLYQRG